MSVGDWSSGMIPASGAGGRGFDSRIAPPFLFPFFFVGLYVFCDQQIKYRYPTEESIYLPC